MALLAISAMTSATAVARSGPEPQSAGYKQVILADRPMIYWRLGEKRGSTAHDASPHGRDATYVGSPGLGLRGAIVDDPNSAVRFDGVDDYAVWAPTTSYQGTFTVEAWVRSTVRGVEDQAFLSTRGPGEFSFDIKLEDSPTYGHGIRADVGNGGGWFVNGTIDFDWQKQVWYHVVGVAGRIAVTIYVNGVSIGALAYGSSGDPLLFDPNHQVTIGSFSGRESWFTGRIDELAVYGYKLSADQVAAHYAAGINP